MSVAAYEMQPIVKKDIQIKVSHDTGTKTETQFQNCASVSEKTSQLKRMMGGLLPDISVHFKSLFETLKQILVKDVNHSIDKHFLLGYKLKKHDLTDMST